MIYRRLGKTGREIPAIGLGTWNMGGKETPDTSRDREWVDTIARAIEMGYTHIDTAERYGAGHTEELIGEAIKLFERDELFITSKAWPGHLTREGLPKALEGTLKRLKSDYVDLYLIHWPNPDVPLDETLAAMAHEVRAGRVRSIGVSNFDLNLLKKTISLSEEPIVNDQVLFNIEDKEPLKGLLPFCQSQGITLTAYSPLKRNVLSASTAKVLQELGRKYYATPQQLMLAWLLGKEEVVVIPKSSSIEHLKSNLDSQYIELTPEDMKLLDELN